MTDQPKENYVRHASTIRNNKRSWVLLLGGPIATAAVAAVVWLQVPSLVSHAQEAVRKPAPTKSNSFAQPYRLSPFDSSVTPLLRSNTGELTADPNAYANWYNLQTPIAGPRPGFRLVIETEMVEQTYEVGVPVGSPAGKEFRSEKRTRLVPVQTTRWVPVGDSAATGQNGDDQVMRMVQELKNLESVSPDSMEIPSKRSELSELLNAEFARMHEQQAAEIESTEKRLAALKKLHEQRGEKQDEIVQRRIDQLLGKANPLDWNINTPKISAPMPYTGSAIPPVPVPPVIETFPVSPQFLGGAEPSERLVDPRYAPAADPSPNAYQRSLPEFGQTYPNDMFAVISKASEAHLALESTKLNLKNVQRLFDQKVISSLDLRKATLEHSSALNAVAVLNLQLKSIERTLLRELQAAKIHFGSESALLKAASDKTERAAVNRELRKAQSAVDAAGEKLLQFREGLRLVPFVEKSDDVTSDVVEPTDEQQPPADANATPPVINPLPDSPANE